jgi:hypothetical protein
LELRLLLWPVFECEEPLDLKEEQVLLFDVLLDVDISALCVDLFLLDEGPNLDWERLELEAVMVAGRGGGIKTLAETCLYIDILKWGKEENRPKESIGFF